MEDIAHQELRTINTGIFIDLGDEMVVKCLLFALAYFVKAGGKKCLKNRPNS